MQRINSVAKPSSVSKPQDLLGGVFTWMKVMLLLTLLLGYIFGEIGGVGILRYTGPILLGLMALSWMRDWVPPASLVPAFLIAPGAIALGAFLSPPVTEYGSAKLAGFLTVVIASFWAATLVSSRDDLHALALGWVIVAVGLAMIVLTTYQGGRAALFGANSIWIGRTFGTGLIFAVWLLMNRSVPRWLGGLVVGTLTLALLSSGSRGPILSAFVGLSVLALAGRVRRTRRFFGTVVIVGVAYLSLTRLPFFEQSRLNTISTTVENESRWDLWAASIRMIRSGDTPVGVGGWSTAARDPINEYPHNIFLEIATEIGIPIAVTVAAVFLWAFVRGFAASRYSQAASIATAVFAEEIVNASVSGDLHARALFFFFGLLVLVVRQPEMFDYYSTEVYGGSASS